MFKWPSTPDSHYSKAITTCVYNRMFLLAIFARCLCVVRERGEQHPGDCRAAVAVLVVAKVEVKEMVVRQSVLLQGWKHCTAAPGDRNGALIIFNSTSVVPSRLPMYEKRSEIVFTNFICSFYANVPNGRFCRGSSRQILLLLVPVKDDYCFFLQYLCFTCLEIPPSSLR